MHKNCACIIKKWGVKYLCKYLIIRLWVLGMDKKTQEKALQALARQEKQYKRQNDYIKNTFDRVSVTLPKGTKEKIIASGDSVNGLINRLVKEYLEKIDEMTGSNSGT